LETRCTFSVISALGTWPDAKQTTCSWQYSYADKARNPETPSRCQGFDALPQTNRLDVVFFLNDHIAFGGMMAAERAGLNVPNDLGIVGFNGIDLNHVLARPITTMSTPRRQMGLVGARHLLARLSGIAPPRNTHLPCTLCPGQTTRAQ
jgi:LacI family transcriptional regulator, gluconate utilization system Gnt-I transcriptional repressor